MLQKQGQWRCEMELDWDGEPGWWGATHRGWGDLGLSRRQISRKGWQHEDGPGRWSSSLFGTMGTRAGSKEVRKPALETVELPLDPDFWNDVSLVSSLAVLFCDQNSGHCGIKGKLIKQDTSEDKKKTYLNKEKKAFPILLAHILELNFMSTCKIVSEKPQYIYIF